MDAAWCGWYAAQSLAYVLCIVVAQYWREGGRKRDDNECSVQKFVLIVVHFII